VCLLSVLQGEGGIKKWNNNELEMIWKIDEIQGVGNLHKYLIIVWKMK
jgi:hypothetical protein